MACVWPTREVRKADIGHRLPLRSFREQSGEPLAWQPQSESDAETGLRNLSSFNKRERQSPTLCAQFAMHQSQPGEAFRRPRSRQTGPDAERGGRPGRLAINECDAGHRGVILQRGYRVAALSFAAEAPALGQHLPTGRTELPLPIATAKLGRGNHHLVFTMDFEPANLSLRIARQGMARR